MSSKKEQIVIIGLGKFGLSIAQELSKFECETMAIDKSDKLISAVTPFVTKAVRVNAIDKEALEYVGVQNFDTAIIGIGDDLESSIMIALTLKELGIPKIIAKSRDDIHTKLLDMIGVDEVVQPDQDSAIRLVKELMHLHIVKSLDFSKDYSIAEIKAPESWVGKKILDLGIRKEQQINIICIKKGEEGETIFPRSDYMIENIDNIMIVAPNSEIEKLN